MLPDAAETAGLLPVGNGVGSFRLSTLSHYPRPCTACLETGRDPATIRRIVNVQGLIGEWPAPPRSDLRVGYLAGEPLAGPAEWWGETASSLVQDGFDPIVFWPVDPSPRQVELLVGEVLPLLSDHIPDRPQRLP